LPGTGREAERRESWAAASGLRAPQAEHLARYQVIDLFLDTNPNDAHMTASDAEIPGRPVESHRRLRLPAILAGP